MIGSNKNIMLPKFMAEFLIEIHLIMNNLKRSLNKMNVKYFEDFACYEKSRLRIEEKIAREKSRYHSDLQEGLDAVSSNPSWSKVVVFR